LTLSLGKRESRNTPDNVCPRNCHLRSGKHQGRRCTCPCNGYQGARSFLGNALECKA